MLQLQQVENPGLGHPWQILQTPALRGGTDVQMPVSETAISLTVAIGVVRRVEAPSE